MSLYKKFIIVLTILSLTSCGTELTRRYKSMEMASRGTEKPLVRASSFVMEAAKSEDKPAILELSAEGQASLITAIAKAEKSAVGLYQQLANGFENHSASDVIDRTQYAVRVVFSVQKTEQMDGLADRISQLEFQFKDLPNSFQFLRWNKFETEYGQVDLGKIGLKRAATFTSKINPSFGGASTGEVGVTGSRELNEEVALRQRFITNTGALFKDNAKIIQEGISGIDLSGNTSIDFTIGLIPDSNNIETLYAFRFDSLKSDKGFKAPNEISFKIISIKAPSFEVIHDDILKNGVLSKLKGNYVVRHVRKGDETINEGDDEVVFIKGDLDVTPEFITLMSNEQLKKTRYRYYIHSWEDRGKDLSIEFPDVPNTPLNFVTYEEANQFLNWLNNTNATTVGGKQLKLNQRPLMKQSIVNLRIWHRE